MKRGGRQHGMVRTYAIRDALWDSRPNARSVIALTAPPTAGLLTRVPTKPTNHSKFTSRCLRSMCHGCHVNPPCKPKNKVKGTQKIRSSSNVHDFRLVTWRVEEIGPGLKFTGFSATSVLDYLADEDIMDRDYDVDYMDYDDDYDNDNDVAELNDNEILSSNVEIEEIDDDNNDGVNDVDHNDDQMSFYEVGFVWQMVEGDENWCLVEEM